MSGSKQTISVIVVISGQPVSVKANGHQLVEHLVHEALKDSGSKGQPPSDWELRTVDGLLIEQSLAIGPAGIVDGMTLYLSPKAGAGGEQ
jgi:hypothetical protein